MKTNNKYMDITIEGKRVVKTNSELAKKEGVKGIDFEVTLHSIEENRVEFEIVYVKDQHKGRTFKHSRYTKAYRNWIASILFDCFKEGLFNVDINDSKNEGKNDYLNTMVEYAKTLEIKHYQKLRRHSMYDDIFDYASKNKLSNNDIELMLYMRQEFDKEEGLPNFPCEFTNNDIDEGKNEGGNSTYEYLIPDTNSRIINGRFEESINTREDGSKWTCFSGHYKSAKKEIFFTATDRENEGEFKIFTNRNQFNNDLLLTDMEHGVYIMHKEWNNKRCTDDDKKDIVGVKVFLEEVKTFSKDTKSTLQGQVHCRQRCYYRLEKYSSDVFVIECKLYTNDDNLYTSRISDMNDDNNISIFKYRGVFEEGFKQLLEFFNRYHKVYNLFIGSNDGKKDISELMSSLMSKLEHSGELRCFMDSSTLTGIIQQCAEKKTYIKYSKNDDCFYIDCQSNIVSLPLVQLINNKLKIYDIEFEIVKADNRRCIRIQLDEGNLSIL